MGTGKGKTTASLGLGLRAAGAGLRVNMIQFLKGSLTHESKSIEHIPNFSITTVGRNTFISESHHEPIDETLAEKGLSLAKKIIDEQSCDVLILDEITVAVAFNLLKKQDILTILKEKPTDLTIVLTGRIADQEFISIADLVTDLKEIKHPYQKGRPAKPGFEY
jgi:cob(I)alamin adenosyltransferase